MTAERTYSTRVAYHVARRLKLRADRVEETFFPRRVPRVQPARVNRRRAKGDSLPGFSQFRRDSVGCPRVTQRILLERVTMQVPDRSRNARASNLQTLLF